MVLENLFFLYPSSLSVPAVLCPPLISTLQLGFFSWMTAKADLLRVLQDVSRSEEAIRADCLSIARRRKMSTEAITRVGTEVGVVFRTSRKPVNVEEAVTCLVRERLKATKSMEGTAIDPTEDVSNRRARRKRRGYGESKYYTSAYTRCCSDDTHAHHSHLRAANRTSRPESDVY